MATKRTDNRQGMTTRWTAEEKKRLLWLSEHLGVEQSNVPRTLLWQFFGNNEELQDKFTSTLLGKDMDA